MKRLLVDPDARVRIAAERLVLSLLHGRPVAADDSENGSTRPDPEAVALRLANYVSGLLAKHPATGGDSDEDGSPAP